MKCLSFSGSLVARPVNCQNQASHGELRPKAAARRDRFTSKDLRSRRARRCSCIHAGNCGVGQRNNIENNETTKARTW
jgi:hypothetical protein